MMQLLLVCRLEIAESNCCFPLFIFPPKLRRRKRRKYSHLSSTEGTEISVALFVVDRETAPAPKNITNKRETHKMCVCVHVSTILRWSLGNKPPFSPRWLCNIINKSVPVYCTTCMCVCVVPCCV
jgi:hypothetical protein